MFDVPHLYLAVDRCLQQAEQTKQIKLNLFLVFTTLIKIKLSDNNKDLHTIKYKYWEDDNMWLGYLQEYPDYLTQAETVEELEENLRDIYNDLSNIFLKC